MSFTPTPTSERAFDLAMERLLTPDERMALYGSAKIVKLFRDETVPPEPVEGAQWPVRGEAQLNPSTE